MDENPFQPPASGSALKASFRRTGGARKWVGLLLYVCSLVVGAIVMLPVSVLIARDVLWRHRTDSPHFLKGVIYLAVSLPITFASGYCGYRLRHRRIDVADSESNSELRR